MDPAWVELLPPGTECRTTPRAERPAGSGGPPRWPTGVVGSITHAGGCRTVALARGDRVAALGIDMEPLAPLPPDVWPHFFPAEELDELLGLPAPQRGLAALSRWCLKEALFKALQGRIPLDALPLSGRHGSWRPAPGLHPALHGLGIHDPGRLVLRSAAAGGWQRAAAWICHPNQD